MKKIIVKKAKKTNHTFSTIVVIKTLLAGLVITGIYLQNIFAANINMANTTFHFSDIKKNGKLYFMIVRNAEAFKSNNPDQKDIAFQAILDVTQKEASISIAGIPPGTYAAKFFLDSNKNGKLDTNAVGLPTELYGFSNNVKGLFGPPDFKDVAFEIKKNKNIVYNSTFF